MKNGPEDKAVTRLKAGGSQKRGPKKLLYAGEVPSGPLPLDYMLSVMRDPTASPKRRRAMAAKALPYCHARLKSVPPPPKSEIPKEVRLVVIDPRDEHASTNSPPVSTPSDES
jgi:hypothetical protein